MTLTTRLTLFFLITLAAVLLAFSAGLYTLARMHLFGQLNDRTTATLDTLVAAAEVEGDGLEWELHSRRLRFPGDQPPVWAVFDETGSRLDSSPDLSRPLDTFAVTESDGEHGHTNVHWDSEHWRVVRRTLRHPIPEAVHSSPDRPRYKSLVFVTAWPVAPVNALLTTLTWSLVGVSFALWVTAGVTSRWVCRRALAPVTRMTEAAKRMTSAELGARLPVPAANDELHDLAAAFNGLLTRLELAFERQRQFTGEASHQLRTPLTAMLGQMEVALRRDREGDEYKRVLTTAVAQAGRLREIVEGLLFLARSNEDAALPDLEVVDLAKWLPTHVHTTWGNHSRAPHLRVDPMSASPVIALAHPTLLGQAVDNLIDNALKYSPPGTLVRVWVEFTSAGALVGVQDEGPGIPVTDRERVFDPFFRSDDARRRGIAGVGLGLAVAARIVRACGGSIVVEHPAGGGTRFICRLPLLRPVVSG